MSQGLILKPLTSLVTRYGCLEFDPPWWEVGGGKIKRGADRHYPLMKTPDICALPVSQVCLSDSHLYLWATNNAIAKGWAHDVARAWGFIPITLITWLKKGNPGLGQYFRGNTEHCLFCRKGQPRYQMNPKTGKRAQGLTGFSEEENAEIEAEIVEGEWWDEVRPDGVHSRKPTKIKEWAGIVSPGPYLEGFARRRFPGWDAWGLEAPEQTSLLD